MCGAMRFIAEFVVADYDLPELSANPRERLAVLVTPPSWRQQDSPISFGAGVNFLNLFNLLIHALAFVGLKLDHDRLQRSPDPCFLLSVTWFSRARRDSNPRRGSNTRTP